MGCCTADTCDLPAPPSDQVLVDHCPHCGGRARRVPAQTISSLVVDPPPPQGWRFCASPGCDVAYLHEQTGEIIGVQRVSVAIGQKQAGPDRTLCYCFDFRARDIQEQVATTGRSTIAGEIAERCRRGEDRCAWTNPQGHCCLGNVKAVERLVLEQRAEEARGVEQRASPQRSVQQRAPEYPAAATTEPCARQPGGSVGS